jgi:ABC-type arginine transport system permease subunit
MIWFGHPAIERKLRMVAALLTLEIFFATLALAIPIQEKLAVTQSTELIDELILYDRYLRTIPGIVVMALNFAMLQQLMRPERPIDDQD